MKRRQKSTASARHGKSHRAHRTSEDPDARTELLVGRVKRQKDRTALIIPEGPARAPVVMAARESASLADGERVTVRVMAGRRRRLRALLVSRGDRRSGLVVGVLGEHGHHALLRPEPPGAPLEVLEADRAGAKAGDVVLAHVVREVGATRHARAAIDSVLGRADSAVGKIELLVHAQGLPMRFTAETQAEAARLPPVDVGAALAEGRRDLRKLPLVTIDDETARDFDDAVAAKAEANGVRIWVAIADVGAYVPAGGAIDRDARERGTSVYFPHRAVPMLPERLSNDLCSLRPQCDRLVLVCEMLVDADGRRHGIDIYPGLMRSHARLTYREVQALIAQTSTPADASWARSVRDLAAVATRLRTRRLARGGLDLDIAEPEVLLDEQGVPRYIRARSRLESHRIIEDLMVAANETVAELLVHRRWPGIFRVHAPPDPASMAALATWGASCGIKLQAERGTAAKTLAHFLEVLKRRPEAAAGQMLVLRSLPQAIYAARNQGHFGLGSRAYLHFTSPIRRYPDLVVHRSLRALWSHASPPTGLDTIAAGASDAERRAMTAERAVTALMACLVAEQHLGETIEATITATHPRGVFVRGKTLMIDGLVSLDQLEAAAGEKLRRVDNDQAWVARHAGKHFRVGEDLTVRIAAVRAWQREIDFEIDALRISRPRPWPLRKRNPRCAS